VNIPVKTNAFTEDLALEWFKENFDAINNGCQYMAVQISAYGSSRALLPENAYEKIQFLQPGLANCSARKATNASVTEMFKAFINLQEQGL